MKALYRKYRPKSLDEVVGQPQVTEPLVKALSAGKVSHAYLFIGPRGTGKTSVARIFAHEVNGFKYELEDDYVDIIEIDGASNRGIDDIRELREKVMIAPTAGKYKIYIIDEVHMLTKEAFNALLKTLEEPPAHVIFIMATTDAHKVPVTITSRAQVYTFQLAEPRVMLEHVKAIAKQENIQIADDALEIIVKRGGGSYRDTLSLLDQISTLSEGEITREQVVAAMGLPDGELTQRMLEAYAVQDVATITDILKTLLASGIKPEIINEELIARIIDEPRVELLPLLAKLTDVRAPFAEAKLLVALIMTDGNQVRGGSCQPLSSPTSLEARQGVPSRAVTRPEKDKPEPAISAPASRPAATEPEKPANSVPTNQPTTTELEQPLVPAPASQPAASAGSFNWEDFLQKVQALNDAIYAQVAKVNYRVSGDALDIYPDKKITKTILSREGNRRILMEAAGGVKVVVHDVGEDPAIKNDTLLSKISDIMGGEVRNDTGGNPF